MTQRVFPVHYEWSRLLTMLALAMGLWLLARLLPPGAWTWPAKLGLWLLWPVVVWSTGLMSYARESACPRLHQRGAATAAGLSGMVADISAADQVRHGDAAGTTQRTR